MPAPEITREEIYADLDESQMNCVGSCADNCWTFELVGHLDNQQELDRLNKHRKENQTMAWLNQLTRAAIILRNFQDQPKFVKGFRFKEK